METFAAVDVIATKRDGGTLSDAQIDWVVDAYTRSAVADEQMSALLMAILLRGMSSAEIARWTAAMIASGERLDLSSVSRPTVDKHSTGGVGDKITLPLTPLVAACGAAVPQLSGRGLGHTGGTLDKLETIPGFRVGLSNEEFTAQLRDIGAVVCAAGDALAPADRKLYALRDVTATVESIPLIASSIMSKKIAEGTSALVLDVKVGTGAFMKDEASARDLVEREGRAPAGDGLELVERAAGVPEPAAGQLRHRRPARRDEGGERQGDLVADAAGGVLVDQRAPDVPEREHLPGVDHRLGPAAGLGRVHPVQQDRHGQCGHLLVGDVAAGVGGDDPVDLFVGQPSAVPFGDDHIDGADPHRSLAHGRDASPPRHV